MNMIQCSTAEKIEASAIALFSRRWYSSVSVAEICREAKLSNGIFYKYFQNKELLIRHILEGVIERIASALSAVRGNDAQERIRSMTEILVRFAAEHKDLITVFREGQYRYFEYEHRLAELYKRTLAQALGRSVSLAEYLYAIGGIRFAAVRAALHGTSVSLGAIDDMLINGIFKGLSWDEAKVFGITVSQPAINLNESSRERLISAGKKLFGSRGFHEVNIHEVTDAAGLSVGAFYKHFESKEAFFGELIDEAGKQVRHFISVNLSTGLNRLERELQGIYLFGVFLSLDRWCYNIVREGEFVAPARVRAYYAAFEHGYDKLGDDGLDPALSAADPLYRASSVEFLLGISHYYGIELLFDGFRGSAKSVVGSIAGYLSEGL